MVSGAALLATGVFVTSFPPIPGYSIFGVFCGYIYGVALGFVPLFIGAFLGGLASFAVLRRYLSFYAEALFRENPKVALVVRAVEGKGVKVGARLGGPARVLSRSLTAAALSCCG